jgi:hypothetical protein
MLVGMHILLKNIREAPQKLKIELPYDPAIPLLGIYPKECKVIIKTPSHPCLSKHFSQMLKL